MICDLSLSCIPPLSQLYSVHVSLICTSSLFSCEDSGTLLPRPFSGAVVERTRGPTLATRNPLSKLSFSITLASRPSLARPSDLPPRFASRRPCRRSRATTFSGSHSAIQLFSSAALAFPAPLPLAHALPPLLAFSTLPVMYIDNFQASVTRGRVGYDSYHEYECDVSLSQFRLSDFEISCSFAVVQQHGHFVHLLRGRNRV